jgi:formate dehydrogenase maturation protein FdhE
MDRTAEVIPRQNDMANLILDVHKQINGYERSSTPSQS